MTDKIFRKKAFISYFEIAILIIAYFAFSYTINEVNNNLFRNGDYKKEGNNQNRFFGRIANFNEIFSGMKLVSAQETRACCELTKNGNTCQNVPLNQCSTNSKSAPTNCEFTEFCKIGCCISPTNGLCNERTSKADCEKSKGVFKDDSSCNVQECRKGCCVIGENTIWNTENNCKWEGNTQNKNLPTNWKTEVVSELQCLFLAEKNKEGSCVFESSGKRKCVLTSLDECFKKTGSEANFFRDKFCSDRELNTTCKAKDQKRCVTGQEDVYWFDSCGNKEDIANDCDFYRGNYCGKDGGEVVCKDIKCDTNGDGIKDRENGESWCSYDAAIGDGKDTVGSRHIKHICFMGSERVAPCADFRNEICVQEDTNLDGKKFSQAACRVNQWRTCLDYNKNKKDVENKCKKNVDCKLKHIDMDGSFNFKVCVPNYPPGFDLIQENLYNQEGDLNENYYKASPAEGICDIATQKCTQTFKCCPFTGCTCIDNCDCSKEKFTKEMNDLCASLGDCGAYINYAGEPTSGGYSVKGAPRLTAEKMGYSKYANINPNPAPPGDSQFFNSLNSETNLDCSRGIASESGNSSAFQRELLVSAGSYGSPLLLEILKQKTDNETEVINDVCLGPIGLSRFTGNIASAKAGIIAQIEEKTKEDKQPKDYSMIAAMIAGLISYLIAQSILISLIASLLAFLFFGVCWTKKVDIYFTCMQWEPPEGGAKCNECNKLTVPCTKYRCESLGQLCHIINKGTGNELCVSKPVNETLPMIKPFENAISNGYKYTNINDNGFEIVNSSDNSCLEPYTPVDIGIKVEPFAKCRISSDSKQSYDEMADLFGPKGNYILPAHLMKLFFPSPEAFKNVYNLTDEQIKVLGRIDYYVRCKSASGKTNPIPYNIKTCIKPGPDLTAPRISVTRPLTGSYVKYDDKDKEVVIYVNEPSECRWSFDDRDFDNMNNSMTCETNPFNYSLYGLPCNANLPVSNSTKFYFRCRDRSENRNTMSESYVFEFKASQSHLFIDEVIPRRGEKIIVNVEPASFKLKLKTSGGAKNGEARCSWEGNGYSDSFVYNNNGSNIHDYQLTTLTEGSYNINFICEDVAENTAENSTYFEVRVDNVGPKITRIYYEEGLKIITSEKAECRYGFTRDFIFENATKMSSDEKNHLADWRIKNYYIQCKDEFGNKGERIKVRPI